MWLLLPMSELIKNLRLFASTGLEGLHQGEFQTHFYGVLLSTIGSYPISFLTHVSGKYNETFLLQVSQCVQRCIGLIVGGMLGQGMSIYRKTPKQTELG